MYKFITLFRPITHDKNDVVLTELYSLKYSYCYQKYMHEIFYVGTHNNFDMESKRPKFDIITE